MGPFLYDKITKTWSLMDSGAQVNLWPKPEGAVEDKSVVLIGANKKRIPAYGVAEKTVRFGRYKKYKTQVIYADITKAILGDRFLREHKLVYDLSEGTIFDKTSQQKSKQPRCQTDNYSRTLLRKITRNC